MVDWARLKEDANAGTMPVRSADFAGSNRGIRVTGDLILEAPPFDLRTLAPVWEVMRAGPLKLDRRYAHTCVVRCDTCVYFD